jgi:aminopeptidase N
VRSWWLLALAACHGGHAAPDAPPGPIDPTENLDRDVTDTQLQFDVTALTATATITFAPSTSPGASLEIGDLTFDSVQWNGVDLPYVLSGKRMDLGLPADADPIMIDLAYHFSNMHPFEGDSTKGYTLDWPYYCGNLFPCHSEPADGTTFTANLVGVPSGMTAVYPQTLAIAPSYQFAWSYDAYTELPLGTTTAGTQLSVWYRPGELAAAQAGTTHLVAAFDWMELTLGPYAFGPKYSSVSVGWPPIEFGGMEHHPNSHISSNAIGDEETNVHESAHGWFGDGIRIACWEDFVLSEGTVSYLAARALDVVAPSVGASIWQSYTNQLANIAGASPVWPQSCGTVDVIKDHLFTNAPYMRGAFFYKAVADKIGATQLDAALAAFFQAHAGGKAGMADMLAAIHTVTGYDPTACAQLWLIGTTVPTPGPCP